MNQKRLRQFKLGKQINYINRIDELIHKDVLPDMVESVKNENDLTSAIRLYKLLDETSDFLKETICRQARIEVELEKLNEDVQKLLPKEVEVVK